MQGNRAISWSPGRSLRVARDENAAETFQCSNEMQNQGGLREKMTLKTKLWQPEQGSTSPLL